MSKGEPVRPRAQLPPGYSPTLATRFPVQRIAEDQPPAKIVQTVPPPTEPGLLAKAGNLAKAIVTHVVAGQPNVTDEELERRLAVCQGCEAFQPDPLKCLACGCNLQIKARWAEQQCPRDKWPKNPEVIVPPPPEPQPGFGGRLLGRKRSKEV